MGSLIELRNVLTNHTVHKTSDELITLERFSNDFIISIPHAGVLVPEELVDGYDNTHDPLIEIDVHSSDPYAARQGVRLTALLAPFVVDLNRSKEPPRDVPHHLTNDPLTYYTIKDRPYRTKPMQDEWRALLMSVYDSYHALLSQAIADMKRTHGYALVIDAHSMTSQGLGRAHDVGEKRPDFAIGTLHGRSADDRLLDAFERSLEYAAKPFGLRVERDTPYAGGFITRLHHDPENDVHVIQLEVSMGTYLVEGWKDTADAYALKNDNLERTRRIVTEAITHTARTAASLYEQHRV